MLASGKANAAASSFVPCDVVCVLSSGGLELVVCEDRGHRGLGVIPRNQPSNTDLLYFNDNPTYRRSHTILIRAVPDKVVLYHVLTSD